MAIDRGANRQSRVYMDIRTGNPSPSRTASGAPARSPSRTPAAPGKTSSSRRRRAPQKGIRGNLSRKPAKLRRQSRAGRMDISFFFLVIVLMTIGLIMVFSASYATSLNENDSGISIVMRQVLFVGLGLVAMFVLSYIPYHLYQKLYRLIYIGCLGLTAFALLFEDRTGAGARRWIYFGGFSFQPSELLKFGLIVTFAALIARNYRQMDTFKKGILEFFYFLIPAFGVVALQRHMSWIMLMVIICGGMMFIAGSKIYYILLLVPVGLLGLVILQALGFDYIGSRIDAWLDPFSDIQNGTWQIVQSLYAIGSGGLFGVGLGNSTQKFLWISEPQNDFIFAVRLRRAGAGRGADDHPFVRPLCRQRLFDRDAGARQVRLDAGHRHCPPVWDAGAFKHRRRLQRDAHHRHLPPVFLGGRQRDAGTAGPGRDCLKRLPLLPAGHLPQEGRGGRFFLRRGTEAED